MLTADDIYQSLSDKRARLLNHRLGAAMTSWSAICQFMSWHVYAVWDFMNLLKTLQQHWTGLTVPWTPPPVPALSRLIHEILLDEESDLIDGQPTSHFDYYYHAYCAMDPKGSQGVQTFMADLNAGKPYHDVIRHAAIPVPVQHFLCHTQSCIDASLIHVTAAFAYGRETLIPTLFTPIIQTLHRHKDAPGLASFIAYLERHIALDGDDHGPLALELVNHTCHTAQDWEQMKSVAHASMDHRIRLWDAMADCIR